MPEIRFEDYVRGVRATCQTAPVLSARLEKAAPADITSDERKALRAVAALALEVQSVQSERDRLGPTRLRPLRAVFINDWSALYEGLGALARISPEVSKNGPAAARIVDSLFPDGVAFLQLPSERAWSEAKRRLDRLDGEGLGERIEALIGKHFVEGAKRSTAQLADAIGTGKGALPVASGVSLSDALLKFQRAVAAYGRLLAAYVDESDEVSCRRFLAAMAPIDQHRATAARSGGGEAPEPEEPEERAITPSTEPTPQPVA